MKNKQNEANGIMCVLCETGEGERHGSECSYNKRFAAAEVEDIMQNITEDKNLCIIRDLLENTYKN